MTDTYSDVVEIKQLQLKMSQLTLSNLLSLCVCPDCHSTLRAAQEVISCSECKIDFPVVNGIPVILPRDSVFSTDQILRSDDTYYAAEANQSTKRDFNTKIRRSLPRITKSWERQKLYELINRELKNVGDPKGLQLGAGEQPVAIADKIEAVSWVHSDVDLAFRPDMIADAVGLPFPSESFDVVYADQVLEHVFDMTKAIKEIQRVTRVGGIIVIGIPFMYPSHGIPYDFNRLTACGLRAAFRETESLLLSRDSGAFVALALQLDNRLINLFTNRHARGAAVILSRFLFGGLKHLDRLFKTVTHISSAASLLYVGRKTKFELSSKEIMKELQQTFSGT